MVKLVISAFFRRVKTSKKIVVIMQKKIFFKSLLAFGLYNKNGSLDKSADKCFI